MALFSGFRVSGSGFRVHGLGTSSFGIRVWAKWKACCKNGFELEVALDLFGSLGASITRPSESLGLRGFVT